MLSRPPARVPVLDLLLGTLRQVDPRSGLARSSDVAALTEEADKIDKEAFPAAAAAAKDIANRLRYDLEVDGFDVNDLRQSARVLKATHPGREGPKLSELDQAIRAAAVKPANLTPRRMTMALDLSQVEDPAVTSFPATVRYQLKGAIPAKGSLAIDPERLEVESVRAGGKEVPFEIDGGQLTFDTGGRRDLEVRFRVTPTFIAADEDWPNATGLIVDRRVADKVNIASQQWATNCNQIFPSNPSPSAGMAAQVNVTFPPGFTGEATRQVRLVPAYAVAVRGSNNFRHVDGPTTLSGTDLGFYVTDRGGLPDDSMYKEALAGAAVELAEVERIVGAPYPDAAIHFMLTPSLFGGMEHQGLPTIGEGALGSVASLRHTLTHEAAHGFTGNGERIASWKDLVMSEGRTEYLTMRGIEARDPSEAQAEWDRYINVLSRVLTRDHSPLVPQEEAEPWTVLNTQTYRLGAFIFRMLESKLGTERFDKLFAEFHRLHDREAVSLDQFTAFVQKKTGFDAPAFFEAWGNLKGAPVFEVARSTTANKVTLRFTAIGGVIPPGTEVPVLLQGSAGQSKWVTVDPSKPESAFDTDFRVTQVTFDPKKTVLANFVDGTP